VLPDVPRPSSSSNGGATAPTSEPTGAIIPAAAKKTTAPIRKTKPSRRLNPGDRICGQCGEGNPPQRKFCSRCATLLEDAAIVTTPWWRKLLPKRRTRTLDAGDRPGRGGIKSRRRSAAHVVPKVRKAVVTLVFVSGFAYGLFPPFRTYTNKHVINPVKNKWHLLTTHEYNDVEHTAAIKSTLQLPDHPVNLAYDDSFKTAMYAPVNGHELVLTLTYPHPVDIDKLVFYNGDPSDFTNIGRVENLHIVFDETGKTMDIHLQDVPEKQSFAVKGAHGVATIEFHATSIYSAQSKDVALTEIEPMFRKR
jgi:hypothetical protein